MSEDLKRDDFLGGRIGIRQPPRGYRAGIDPVLLAAFVCASPGQTVLELGCGVGTALLCLGARVPDLDLVGLELQQEHAALARLNAAENGIDAEIHCGDLSDMPPSLRARRFDHVIANPPYFDRASGKASSDMTREIAMGEGTPLATWISAAAKRCAPKGYVSLIHRAERLPELLMLMNQRLGSLQVLPMIPRAGRPARLVLVRGRPGGRAPFRLHDGIVMHQGATHDEDRENYTQAMTSVLRRGEALICPERTSQADR